MEKRFEALERRVEALERLGGVEETSTPQVREFIADVASPIRVIKVCAGIGDNIWLIQKLLSTKEKFIFKIAADEPKRGKQIFDLTPDIVAHSKYDGSFTSLGPIDSGIQNTKNRWADVDEVEFSLSANTHLEHGYRLEWFMPDLPTTFRVPWKTEQYRYEAEELLPKGTPYVGLYGSAYSSTRHWGFWGAKEWCDLAINVRNVVDPVFVIIGAKFDLDLAGELGSHLANRSIKQVSLIGKPLGLVIEVMKRLSYFFSFPSGLGMLSTSVGCPTLMFYPPHLEKMINAWAEPESIMNGLYTGALFMPPVEALKMALENGSLKERLNAAHPVSS